MAAALLLMFALTGWPNPLGDYLRAAEVARPVTLVVTSDPHYRLDDERAEENRLTIAHINEIAEGRLQWPAELGGDTVAEPHAVAALGDLIDDGDKADATARQWARYVEHFGHDGSDGLLRYPVLEGWGNHDGPPEGLEQHGFSLQRKLKQRNASHLQAGRIHHLSDNGLHYSWRHGGVHFIQVNIYPADHPHPLIRYTPQWHDPQGALSFLVKDLETHVGDSGRPVVVMGHTGFDSDWWHYEDKTAFYEALRGYRVLAYLYGHTGTGVKPWRPRPEAPLLDCLNTGQTTRGFYVLEISSDRFRAAYRQRRDGEWSWAHTLDRPLADPLPMDQGPAPEPWAVGGDQPVADPGAAVFVRIGAPGNPPDQRLDPPAYSPDGVGSVGHEFELAAHPVTAAHYAAFLNAVAAGHDAHGLYDPRMAGHQWGCGIVRIDNDGRRRYQVADSHAGRPVNFVSLWNAMRYANWLHNGRPGGGQDESTTERGAYTLDGETGEGRSVGRNDDARYWIPSEDEWHKAAHHDGTAWTDPAGDGAGPWGSRYHAGPVREWTDTFTRERSWRRVLGRSFLADERDTRDDGRANGYPMYGYFSLGFRIARPAGDPEA